MEKVRETVNEVVETVVAFFIAWGLMDAVNIVLFGEGWLRVVGVVLTLITAFFVVDLVGRGKGNVIAFSLLLYLVGQIMLNLMV